MEYHFNEPPEIGYSYTRPSGQTYELVAVQPYVRRSDKGASFLLTWRSKCLDCPATFEVTAGMSTNGLNRRCATHKSPMQVQRAHVGKDGREAKRKEEKAAAPTVEAWREGPYEFKLVGSVMYGRFGYDNGRFVRFQFNPDKPLKIDSVDIALIADVEKALPAIREGWRSVTGEPDGTDLLS